MTTHYTDEQMALILKRATELQAAGEESIHSLESIQQIAVQVGIDPRLVADAAATLTAKERGVSPGLLGWPPVCRIRRTVSTPFQSIDRAAAIATIRDHMPAVGDVKELANGFEWRSGSADIKTAITIMPSGSSTEIRVDGRYHGAKVMFYLGAGITTLFASVVATALSPHLGPAIGAGMLVASFVAARTLWNHIATHSRQRVANVVELLAAQFETKPR